MGDGRGSPWTDIYSHTAHVCTVKFSKIKEAINIRWGLRVSHLQCLFIVHLCGPMSQPQPEGNGLENWYETTGIGVCNIGS